MLCTDNEALVGKAIRESGIPRSEIFLTTKLRYAREFLHLSRRLNVTKHRYIHATRVREAFEDSLKELDCEYIDLYLMHWPITTKADGTQIRGTVSITFRTYSASQARS